MARADSKSEGRGSSFGLSALQEQLQRLQNETATLASRVRDEASDALSGGQRAVAGIVNQAARFGDDIQQWV